MANVQICVFNPVTTLIDQITAASVGPGTPGQPVVLNSLGIIDPSLLGQGVIATAGQNISAGNLVSLYNQAGTLFMQLASAAGTGTAPSGAAYPVTAAGFVSAQVFTGFSGEVSFSGTFVYIDGNNEFGFGDIGTIVFLSAITPGGVTKTPPASGSPPTGALSQSVGYIVGFTAPNRVTVAFSAAFLDFTQINGILPVSKGGTGATTGGQALINLIAGSPATGEALVWNGTAWVPSFGAQTSFANILSGTNTVATMTVGVGATLTFAVAGSPASSGVINANEIYGVQISAAAPVTGQALLATSSTTAAWQTIAALINPANFPGQTASLGPITMFTPSATGMFRVSVYEECTVAGASGGGSPFGSGVFGSGTFNIADDNVQTVVSWSDDVGLRMTTPIPTPLDLAGTNAASGDVFIRAAAGQPITFQTFLANTGAPTYGVFLRLESL